MSRADRVAGRLEDVDALLVTEPANLRYVTGFTGSNGFAVVGPRRAPLRHRLPLRRAGQGRGAGLRPRAGAAGAARRAVAAWTGVARLGFDDGHMSVRAFTAARRAGAATASSSSRPRAIVEAVRAVKEPGEMLRIGAAAALVDEIYGWLLEFGIVGRTEREVAVALEHEMRLRGASGPSFDSIVASAEHGALPHATPRDVAIARRHAGHDRHRRGARRLLLGLHAHLGDGLGVRTSWPRSTRSCCARRSPRWTPCGPGRRAASSTPSRATSSTPPATASTSATGSATASGSSRTRRRGWRAPPRPRWSRATSSPSSRASTCPGSAACGSRTSSWSPRTAAMSSRGPRKSS